MEKLKFVKVCVVDTDNKFNFLNYTFEIDQSIEMYKVHNKAVLINDKVVNDYTNYAKMSKIKVVMIENEPVRFYDENGTTIDSSKITIVD